MESLRLGCVFLCLVSVAFGEKVGGRGLEGPRLFAGVIVGVYHFSCRYLHSFSLCFKVDVN